MSRKGEIEESAIPNAKTHNSPAPQMNVRPPAQQQQQPWKSAKAADGQIYYYNETTGEHTMG